MIANRNAHPIPATPSRIHQSRGTRPGAPEARGPGLRGVRHLATALLCAALAGCGGSSSQSPSTGPEKKATPSGQGAGTSATGQGAEPSEPQVTLPEPVVLPQPPFRRFVADDVAKAAKPRKRKPSLVQLSMKLNEITDTERWFRDHAFSLPVSQEAPAGAATYRGVPLSMRIEGNPTLLVYQSRVINPVPNAGQTPAGQTPAPSAGQTPAGQTPAPAKQTPAPAGQTPAPSAGQAPDAQQPGGNAAYLVGLDPTTGEARFAFDLSSFSAPPAAAKGAEALVNMDIRWALVDGDRLYVNHSHSTYAASSRGVNAYITALRIPDGAMLWRSQPLVHNGHNFALVPTSDDPATNRPVLITGYGFTAELDWMYVLDAETGAVLNKTKVLSGPEYIVPQGEIVYVRAYNRDYAFRLQL